MLGRGMADDGRSARPTVTTAGTCSRGGGPGWDDMRSGDEPDGTRSGDGRYGTRQARRQAIRRRTIRHATTLFLPDNVWCGCPVVRLSGGAAARWRDDVLLCPVMPGYARLCPVMSGYVRLYPLMRGDARSLRLPGRFGTMLSLIHI